MGLNPPFGLNARLANQFIDKALTFRPKLLILIVPEETRRLDTKKPLYDLIWEDRSTLSGKSFYLPGSIDVNDKQIEQWNVRPPVLYLWSRPDWTSKHKAIASIQGHSSKLQPSLLVHKDSQTNTVEDTSTANKNVEEKHKEKAPIKIVEEKHKEKAANKNVEEKHKEKAPNKNVEEKHKEKVPNKNVEEKHKEKDANNQGDKEKDANQVAPERQETRKEVDNKKKQIQERSEKREKAAALVQNESRREVPIKQQRSEERPEKKSAATTVEKDGRPNTSRKMIARRNRKRKSLESRKDISPYKTKMLKEQQQHQQEQEEMEEIPMSISPPDRREPADLSTPKLAAFEAPFDVEKGFGGGHAGVGRPSSILHEDADIIARRYNTAERDSFYTNSPHGLSGPDVYSIPNTDKRFQSHNIMDTFNGTPYVRNGFERPEPDLRAPIRTYGLTVDELANSYGRSSDTDLRPQFRNYGGEEISDGYGRAQQTRSYGIPDVADLGNRFSLGGSLGAAPLAQPGLYSSSSYRFLSPAAEASAMPQRYTPRLDEMSHLRSQPMSPGIPFSSRLNNPQDSFGYPPGSSSSFPNRGGSFGGWVDD